FEKYSIPHSLRFPAYASLQEARAERRAPPSGLIHDMLREDANAPQKKRDRDFARSREDSIPKLRPQAIEPMRLIVRNNRISGDLAGNIGPDRSIGHVVRVLEGSAT